MVWWSKIEIIKLSAAALITAGLGGLIYWAYRIYQEDPQESIEKKQEQKLLQTEHTEPNLQEQIHKIKESIDFKNPSIEEVKKILTVLATHLKEKTAAQSHKFKAQRRSRFPREQRWEHMADYLKYSSDGLIKMQQVIMNLQDEQTKIMRGLGIDGSKYNEYAAELGPFMQTLVYDHTITLEQVKLSINLKTDYLQTHGEKIISNLIDLSSGLSLQEKQFIPLFLNIIISDEAFEARPELDKEEYEMAYEKYAVQARAELIGLERVIIPLMGKLQTALMSDQMGGFGIVDTDLSEQEKLREIGLMANEEAMNQQLQMMRKADPEGYSQMIAMVQAQNN